ncbi:hypothetical protein Ancab_032641 [Ancistrocladus abbreviatus]
MFKSARRRSEKNKITAVFKLRFHATQVSQLGENALVLSLVPVDTGKPTAKLENSTIQDGGCYWENAVYETVKFVQDSKTGKLHERIYNFIISTGLPKSSFVGEVSVNIAEYAEATKAASVSLPFKSSNSEGVLHVLIQRIEANANQRDLEENGVAKIRVGHRSLKRRFGNGDAEESDKTSSIEDKPLRKTMSHIVGLNGGHRTSSGSDITLSSSDSSSGLNTPRELRVRSTSIHQAVNASNYHDQQRTQWELSLAPNHDTGTQGSTNSSRDAFCSVRSHLAPEDSVEKLKSDLVVLARKAEVSELELQTLRKQIMKEGKRGQDLLREVASLKEERDVLKEECEKLKASQKWGDELKVRSKCKFEGDPWALLEEIRRELNYEKDLNTNLQLQLQKTQESNSELILAGQDLEQMLEQHNRGHFDPSMRPALAKRNGELEERTPECQSSDDEDQKALEELVRQHTDAKEAYLLEQNIMDLCSEVEMYRRDKVELEMQMEQLALDYEVLKQDNHEMSYKLEQYWLQEQLKLHYECSSSYATTIELEAQIEKLENELNSKLKEYADSLATIKELETHIQNLEEELDKQARRFDSNLEAAASVKVEQEVKIEKLERELKNQSEEFSASLATSEDLETRIQKLEGQLEKQAQGYEVDLGAATRAKMEQELRIENLENELNNRSREASNSSAVIKELETHIRNLEEELEKQARGFEDDLMAVTCAKVEQGREIEKLENELKSESREVSNSSAVIKELETHIQNLEEELVKQAQGFEADLEALTRGKVEQEQRAIRAEEALRLTRWKNVNTAERLQEEFKRVSMQMQSTFEANEKLVIKALAEAGELRQQNSHLVEMLQKATNELQSVKDHYEAKLHELSYQINMKSNQIRQMMEEHEEKSKQLKDQKKHEDEAKQMQQLKSEREQMEKTIKERERENLEGAIASVEESVKSREELNATTCLSGEKKLAITNLQSEADTLRIQCVDLMRSLYDAELEKEKLRKQVFQLKADLKKGDALTSMERKLSDNNGRATGISRPKAMPKSNKSELVPRGAREVATLKEKIILLEGVRNVEDASLNGNMHEGSSTSAKNLSNMECTPVENAWTETSQFSSSEETVPEAQLTASITISCEQDIEDLLKQIMLLKEKNDSMESELMDMQERYSEISLKFAEVEGERQQLIISLRNLKNGKS